MACLYCTRSCCFVVTVVVVVAGFVFEVIAGVAVLVDLVVDM